jgi:hypothetical protein
MSLNSYAEILMPIVTDDFFNSTQHLKIHKMDHKKKPPKMGALIKPLTES